MARATLMPETETKRLFVAIFPPASIVTRLQAAAAGFGKGLPARAIRWTRPEQIHLTLQFLGAIQTARIPKSNPRLQPLVRDTGAVAFA